MSDLFGNYKPALSGTVVPSGEGVTLYNEDCRTAIKKLADNSIDSVVTDPPYALVSITKRFGKHGAAPAKSNGATGVYNRASAGFMGKTWDTGEVAFDPEFWSEVLRVLKPGGHILAFGGTRSYHRLVCAIEDAGFEIRDQIGWLYGVGFPKSLDVSKAIDKAAGAEREKIRHAARPETSGTMSGKTDSRPWIERSRILGYHEVAGNVPVTPEAQQWQGWGTALKPSHEPVVCAIKPLSDDEELRITLRNLTILRAKLWLMYSVKIAKTYSESNQVGSIEETFDFAQWDVEKLNSTLEGLSDLTGTSLCESALITSLNTVSSWVSTLADVSKLGNTSTIETTLDMTIDWKTLKSCTLQITPLCTIPDSMTANGLNVHATSAVRYFSAILVKLNAILELSVLENATVKEQINYPVGVVGEIPICLARKPLIGTVAENVLTYGTGGVNIDGCRVNSGPVEKHIRTSNMTEANSMSGKSTGSTGCGEYVAGRHPANIIHDGSDEVIGAFPDSKGQQGNVTGDEPSDCHSGVYSGPRNRQAFTKRNDSGSAARFFYSAKTSRSDRTTDASGNDIDLPATHPTVKPTDLMAYLCRLVTPPGGVVLDPFMGSGSTGKAALREGFRFVGFEREAEYFEIAKRRVHRS